MSFNDSLKFTESLIANDMKLSLNQSSGKIIGAVTIDEYNKAGELIFSETTHNDVTLPGSIFVLEQIFKTAAHSECGRFTIPTDVPIFDNSNNKTNGNLSNTSYKTLDTTLNEDDKKSDSKRSEYISDEYIFGFMVGNKGEHPSGVISPKYETNSLIGSQSENSFLPLRITDSDANNPNDNRMDYYLKLNIATKDDNGNDSAKSYYYAKAFSGAPRIYTKYADGSGYVTDAVNTNVPILTYAEVSLTICEDDIREYFQIRDNGLEDCYINQLGLIAGKPKWVPDKKGLYEKTEENGVTSYKAIPTTELNSESDRYRLDFDDVRLVTTLNFKTKELSNNENTIKFTYKIYCL